jgi:AcrR family transcriptional regulator
MATSEDQRVKITKLLLKNSLIDLLFEKDMSKITVKEICLKAEINRSTFYSHYSNAYDLLESIRQEYLNNILKAVPINNLNIQDTTSAIINVLNYILQNKKLSQLLIGEQGNVNFQKRIMGLIFDDFQIVLIELTGINKTKAEFISSYVITGSIGVLQNWINNDFDQSVASVAQVISDLSKTIVVSIGEEHGIKNINHYL